MVRLSPCQTSSWLANVRTEQLPGAVHAMHTHAKLDDRYEGMQVLDPGDGGELEVLLAPNRKAKVEPGQVDLAAQLQPDDRGLAWRDYVVRPNHYPQVPRYDQHTLIVTRAPERQGFDPRRLGDMIDFQAAMSAAGKVTLHYNGIAGNSQQHWHWQSTRETVPLQELLDAGSLPLDVLRRDERGITAAYDHGFYAGLLVQGRKDYVVSRATELVARLDADPATRGAYNLLMVKPADDGTVRLAIIPRRREALKPEDVSLGALNLGGWHVVNQAELPEGFHAQRERVAAQTVVRPGELAWLEGLRQTAALQPELGWQVEAASVGP